MSGLGDLTVEHLTGVSVVALSGEHDLATMPALERKLGALIAGGAKVVVDLSEATFIDSSIVRVLYRGEDGSATVDGPRMALAAPPGTPPRRLIDLIALTSVVPTFDSRAAAVAHVRNGGPAT